MVANEMEGELAMAGIKEGAKWTPVDFRNPCISMDFGTTLDGRITSDVAPDDPNPFAKTIGNFCGLAGAIPDAIVRGTGLVQQRTGTALDIFGEHSVTVIAYYEKHAKRPPLENLEVITKALGITVDELLGVKPLKKQPGAPKDAYLQRKLQKVKELNKNDQKVILTMIDAATKKGSQ